MKILIFIFFILTFVLSFCGTKQKANDFLKEEIPELTLSKNESGIEQNTNNNSTISENTEQSIEKVGNYGIKIINVYDHDPLAYTQGFLHYNGYFYESTGLIGHSSLRKVDIKTGNILQEFKLSGRYFAEGIDIFGDKIYQLTWISRTCLVYDLNTLTLLSEFSYDGQGWGLCRVDELLVMSNGSNILKFYEPENFEMVKTISVTHDGEDVKYLNELEYINGEIWANVYLTRKIARIDPIDGSVKSWVDLSDLYDYIAFDDYPDVLNGIAYDSENNKLYVTGKLWKYVFEIELVEK